MYNLKSLLFEELFFLNFLPYLQSIIWMKDMLGYQIFSFSKQISKITYCTLIYKNRAKNRAVWNSKIAPKIAARFLAPIFHFLGKIAPRDFFFARCDFKRFWTKIAPREKKSRSKRYVLPSTRTSRTNFSSFSQLCGSL